MVQVHEELARQVLDGTGPQLRGTPLPSTEGVLSARPLLSRGIWTQGAKVTSVTPGPDGPQSDDMDGHGNWLTGPDATTTVDYTMSDTTAGIVTGGNLTVH